MIKIGPKNFWITSLFCLRQHFSMITSLIFIQNLSNCNFVCIYWTVYCPRIHYHLFESYWVVLSKYLEIMTSLTFIFCWHEHFFLIIIQREIFLFDCHNLLKNNLINTKMSQDLFQDALNIYYLFFSKSGYVTSNEIEWRYMTYFS